MAITGNLGKIIKQRRLLAGLTLSRLGVIAGVSASHLGRIERGERYPSARVLRRIAKPLGIGEGELFTFAGFLSPQPSSTVTSFGDGQLDPSVAAVLSQESVEVQRAMLGILSALKYIARGIALEKSGGGNTPATR